MATRGRGGKRTPANPAPVSGPGAASRRTDGGPSQPVREIPGGTYGDRRASTQLQQAAPLSAGGGASLPPGGIGGGGPVALQDVFAPTGRPGEPITAGSEPLPQQSQMDPVLTALQVMFEQHPNEDLARLIQDIRTRGNPGGRR